MSADSPMILRSYLQYAMTCALSIPDINAGTFLVTLGQIVNSRYYNVPGGGQIYDSYTAHELACQRVAMRVYLHRTHADHGSKWLVDVDEYLNRMDLICDQILRNYPRLDPCNIEVLVSSALSLAHRR
jgi:hypothetical protein